MPIVMPIISAGYLEPIGDAFLPLTEVLKLTKLL